MEDSVVPSAVPILNCISWFYFLVLKKLNACTQHIKINTELIQTILPYVHKRSTTLKLTRSEIYLFVWYWFVNARKSDKIYI